MSIHKNIVRDDAPIIIEIIAHLTSRLYGIDIPTATNYATIYAAAGYVDFDGELVRHGYLTLYAVDIGRHFGLAPR